MHICLCKNWMCPMSWSYQGWNSSFWLGLQYKNINPLCDLIFIEWCRVYAISIYWSKLVIRKEIMYNFYKKASKTSSTLLSSNLIPFHLKRRHCKGTYCYLCKYKTVHLVFSVTCRLNYLSESPPPVHNTGSPHCRHKTLTGHVSLVSLNILIFQP